VLTDKLRKYADTQCCSICSSRHKRAWESHDSVHACVQERKKVRKEEAREKRSEAMKRVHEARRSAAANAGAVGAKGPGMYAAAGSGAAGTLIVEDTTLPGATEPPPPGDVIPTRLPPDQLSLLLQVWSFLHSYRELLTIEAVPTLEALEASLFAVCAGTEADAQAAPATGGATPPCDRSAEAPFLTAVVPLVRLLAADVYRVVMDSCVEDQGDESAQQKDLAAGTPIVDARNWRHVSAGLFAGAQHLCNAPCSRAVNVCRAAEAHRVLHVQVWHLGSTSRSAPTRPTHCTAPCSSCRACPARWTRSCGSSS
jgi:hypothetical protein